jgi:hypothetical protein
MKISWPWRRNKTLSLFDGWLEWPQGRSSVGKPRLAPQREVPDKAHAKNAAGPFYVVNTECMTCGYPHALAPDLMEWEKDSEGHECHCYFKRQPGSSQEIEQAVNAINGSCCGALRYSGSDPEIIKRIS